MTRSKISNHIKQKMGNKVHIYNTQHVLTLLFLSHVLFALTDMAHRFYDGRAWKRAQDRTRWRRKNSNQRLLCISSVAQSINAKRHQPYLWFSLGRCVHLRHHVNTSHNFSTLCAQNLSMALLPYSYAMRYSIFCSMISATWISCQRSCATAAAIVCCAFITANFLLLLSSLFIFYFPLNFIRSA